MKKASLFTVKAGHAQLTFTLKATGGKDSVTVKHGIHTAEGIVAVGNVELLKSSIMAEAIEQDWAGGKNSASARLEDWASSSSLAE
jgi:hypothetical protein